MIRKNKVVMSRLFSEPQFLAVEVKDIKGTFEGKEITFRCMKYNKTSEIKIFCKIGDTFTEEMKVIFRQISEYLKE